MHYKSKGNEHYGDTMSTIQKLQYEISVLYSILKEIEEGYSMAQSATELNAMQSEYNRYYDQMLLCQDFLDFEKK